jgi:hypothetical protein
VGVAVVVAVYKVAVWQCVAVCGSVWQCVAVCGCQCGSGSGTRRWRDSGCWDSVFYRSFVVFDVVSLALIVSN